MSSQETPYPFKGKHGEALKDFKVLVATGQIAKYPMFWKEFAYQLYEDIDDVQKELEAYKSELDAACKHVEELCKKRTLYRIVADRAREFETITSTSNRIALLDALKELGEK